MDIYNPRATAEIFLAPHHHMNPVISAAAFTCSGSRSSIRATTSTSTANMLMFFARARRGLRVVDPVTRGHRPAADPARRPRAEPARRPCTRQQHRANLTSISAGRPSRCGARARRPPTRPVLAMLEEIGTVDNIPKFLDRREGQTATHRLMGFGHRVYKNFDPRAKIIRMCHRCCASSASDNPLFELAAPRRDRAEGRLLHRAQALPERRLLLRASSTARSASRARCSPVMFAIARTPAGSSSGGDDLRPGHEDRPPAPALHRPASATTSPSGKHERMRMGTGPEARTVLQARRRIARGPCGDRPVNGAPLDLGGSRAASTSPSTGDRRLADPSTGHHWRHPPSGRRSRIARR